MHPPIRPPTRTRATTTLRYGRTEIIQDNHEPVFDTPIKMPFLPDQVQRIRIEVRDDDGKNGAKYEIIGSVGQKVSNLVTKWPPEEVIQVYKV